jgi:hypothetical protein
MAATVRPMVAMVLSVGTVLTNSFGGKFELEASRLRHLTGR